MLRNAAEGVPYRRLLIPTEGRQIAAVRLALALGVGDARPFQGVQQQPGPTIGIAFGKQLAFELELQGECEAYQIGQYPQGDFR